MIWIARFIFAALFLTACDGLYALLGLLLSSFSFDRHPLLHRIGLFFLAMSFFTYARVLPRRCQLCCDVDRCRNWTCPEYSSPKKTPRD